MILEGPPAIDDTKPISGTQAAPSISVHHHVGPEHFDPSLCPDCHGEIEGVHEGPCNGTCDWVRAHAEIKLFSRDHPLFKDFSQPPGSVSEPIVDAAAGCFFCAEPVDDPHLHHPDREARPDYVVPVHPQCHQKHHGIEPRDLGAYTLVGVLGIAVDEAERLRIATENRLRSVEHYGLDERRLTRLREDVATVKLLEKARVKELEKAVGETPLAEFIKTTPGLGMKTVGRLLGRVGDPSWNPLHGRDRTVSELWAYCKMHTVLADANQLRLDALTASDGVRTAPRKRKGQKANWDPRAGAILHVIAEGMIKNRASAYRQTYDAARAKYAERDWTDGHRHNAALRIVKKAVLKDLWIAALAARPGQNEAHLYFTGGSALEPPARRLSTPKVDTPGAP